MGLQGAFGNPWQAISIHSQYKLHATHHLMNKVETQTYRSTVRHDRHKTSVNNYLDQPETLIHEQPKIKLLTLKKQIRRYTACNPSKTVCGYPMGGT